MKISLFGIELVARKAPAKRRRPTPSEPQPAAARLKRPEQITCWSTQAQGAASNLSLELPGKTTPWYRPVAQGKIARIY